MTSEPRNGPSSPASPITLDRLQGCLLGGAIGDALGANVEFSSSSDLITRFGREGVRDYVDGVYPAGAFTDDTQLTLFTAEGLIRAENRYRSKGICNPVEVLRRAYLRWYSTQETEMPDWSPEDLESGFLVREAVLHARRAPGATCLSALSVGGQDLSDESSNNSKGCGTVMRSAPIAVIPDPQRAYAFACECAAITHGHPTAQSAAGALVLIIHVLLRGGTYEEGARFALEVVGVDPRGEETARALRKALELVPESGSSGATGINRRGLDCRRSPGDFVVRRNEG